jgi:hypothetical protein
MAPLKELTAAFSAAVGHRRYILPSLTLAAGGLLDLAMLKFGILIDADGPFAYLPFAVAVAIAGAMIMWWLLDYAASGRAELRSIVDTERALDELSAYFDEGSSQVFNAVVETDADFEEWQRRRAEWYEKVQQYLQVNFGLRERNIFRNVILTQSMQLPGSYNDQHNHGRCLLIQQLETIRETIIRYSDLAAKRRAESK